MARQQLKWTMIENQPQSPTARCGHSSAVWGPWLIIFGGFSNCYANDCFMYNTRTKVWKSIHPLYKGSIPAGRSCQVSVVYLDCLYVHGGYVEECKGDLYELDLHTFTWKQKRSGPPLAKHTAVIYNHLMYIYAGETSTNQIRVGNMHTYNFKKNKWKQISMSGDKPAPRRSHTAVVVRNSMFIFGGESPDTSNDLYEFTFFNNKWKRIHYEGGIPPARRRHCSVAFGDYIYILGGEGSQTLGDVWCYNVLNNRMELVDCIEPPEARMYASCQIVNEEIYLHGGFGIQYKNDFHKCKLPMSLKKPPPKILEALMKERFIDIVFINLK